MTRSPFIYIVFLCLWLAGAACWADSSISIARGNGQETIAISLPGAVKARVFTLAHPDRQVVDLPALPRGTHVEMPRDYNGNLIKSVRLGRFDAKTSRLVFDL